jgi:signal transduction histidine kinase
MEAGGGGETPHAGSFRVPTVWTRVIRQGDSRRSSRDYPRVVVLSTATAGRPLTAKPRGALLLDAAIATAALAASLALLSHGGAFPVRTESGLLDPAGILLAGCATVPLVGWRRLPLGVLAVTAAASAALAGLGYPVDLTPGPTIALFLLAASRHRGAPWTWRTTVTVLGLLVGFLGACAAVRGGFPGVALLHTGLVWAVAWFAGDRARLRREHVADLRERALRAEREAERERLLASAQERARIARDLHDSAGHAISVIAVRAGAARLRHHQHPDRSLLALAAIEELARNTAAEIDQIVGNLRDGSGLVGEAVEAPPGLASFGTLVAGHAAAGLEVGVGVAGTPRSLGGAADQAAYRILQEALTNAARHGAGSARVELAFGDAAVELTVTNPVGPDPVPRSSGGHGLVGMRERAALLDGSLDAGRVNGAFRVRARIPYPAHPS